MPKVKTHPLAEIISKKLFGISTVPKEEQERMVARAVKAAVAFHESEMDSMYIAYSPD